MVLILSGIESELHGIRSALSGSGNGPEQAFLAAAGPGLIRAAMGTQRAIAACSPTVIFSVGTAGGLAPELELYDIFVATDVIQHDLDLRAVGLARGAEPASPVAPGSTHPRKRRSDGHVPDEVWLGRVLALLGAGATPAGVATAARAAPPGAATTPSAADAAGPPAAAATTPYAADAAGPPAVGRIVTGRLLSGSAVVDERVLAERPELLTVLHGDAVDMETVAVAVVAEEHGIPWVSVRVISDLPGRRGESFQPVRFKDAVQRASELLEMIILTVLPDPGGD